MRQKSVSCNRVQCIQLVCGLCHMLDGGASTCAGTYLKLLQLLWPQQQLQYPLQQLPEEHSTAYINGAFIA